MDPTFQIANIPAFLPIHNIQISMVRGPNNIKYIYISQLYKQQKSVTFLREIRQELELQIWHTLRPCQADGPKFITVAMETGPHV